MPYRTFTDSAGTDWQVWDIVPRLQERRAAPPVTDRRVDIVPIAFADRRRQERRVKQSPRASLRGAYAQGWLCFECDQEKRRLSPIPSDWTTCDDDRLEEYARQGERVPLSRHALWPGDDSLAQAG